ncbi:MAG: UPF0280 family protein [Desulfarculus sp.]|nr:UPF0280 family protein [Desulfarculus sp.]
MARATGGIGRQLTDYEERTYRVTCREQGLQAFTVRVKETDLWIQAQEDLSQPALESILRHRRGLEAYIEEHPLFLASLTPLPQDPLAPPLVRAMLAAGLASGTGPMAAVAGAVAQFVATDLLALSPQVVVENGGDIYLALERQAVVGLWAGKSPLSGKLGLKLPATAMPLAVCTSSGTVGPSLSLGRADAATILAKDAALADAAASALGNRVQGRGDLAGAVEWVAQWIPGVLGALAVLGDRLSAWGDIELVELGG